LAVGIAAAILFCWLSGPLLNGIESVSLDFVSEDYTKASFDDLLNMSRKGEEELHQVCIEAYGGIGGQEATFD
jgi:hypothetical protein